MTLKEEWQDIADAAANRIVNNYNETMSLLSDRDKETNRDAFSFLGFERD